ncbi:MAG: hypothetical protein ABIE14_05675 [Patescibacteria group bacterium]
MRAILDSARAPIIRSEQLIGLIDEIDLNQLGMRRKIEEEISRYQKFTVGVLGDEAKIPKMDVRKYAKGACPRGSGGDKRGEAGDDWVFEGGVESEEWEGLLLKHSK